MKKFDRLIAAAVLIMAALTAALNIMILRAPGKAQPLYKVELSRAERGLREGRDVSAADYSCISGIYRYDGSPGFYDTGSEYVIREINGTLYRIEYTEEGGTDGRRLLYAADIAAGAIFLFVLGLLLYLRRNIIKPFSRVSDMPYELAKGNLSLPVKENRERYFGKFTWGLDMLREELERSRQQSLERAREEKTLLLSLSHDIKTPLSAIKLYSQALSRGLYSDGEKQRETAAAIGTKADEIESYVAEMISGLSSDALTFDIKNTDFYLSRVMDSISAYYSDKLSMLSIGFTVDKYGDCLLSGDPDRLEEVLQNIIENAVKYGDGRSISVSFSEEEDCRLITVSNSGCTLPDAELPHIFDSFWRGSNTGSRQGSGLGLYICRRLMNGMGGDIFAEISDGNMKVTAVCRKTK